MAISNSPSRGRIAGDATQPQAVLPAKLGWGSVSKTFSKDEITSNVTAGHSDLHDAVLILFDAESKAALERVGIYNQYRLNFSRISGVGSELQKSAASVKFYDIWKKRHLYRLSAGWREETSAYKLDLRVKSAWARLGLNVEDGSIVEIPHGVLLDVNPNEQSDPDSNYDIHIDTDENNASADGSEDHIDDHQLPGKMLGLSSATTRAQGGEWEVSGLDDSSDTRSLHSVSSSIFGNPWLKQLDAREEAVASTSGVATPVAIAFSATSGSEENRTDENKELLGLLVLRNF